ncbi:MAG: NAD(P)H-dependent oxidoreductase [Waddliaceae bacterium]
MKILAFSGSLRKGSYNKKLVKIAAQIAKAKGAEVQYIDLIDYQMPIYNADIEESSGLPDNAKKMKQMMVESDGFLIASPEYNSSITAALKNSMDWVSRPEDSKEPNLIAFKGKLAALMSASPGYFGGYRSLTHLRSLLQNVGVLVTPDYLNLPNANEAFNDKEQLIDESKRKKLESVVTSLLDFDSKKPNR